MPVPEPRLGITASILSIDQLFSGRTFFPASVQREYQWQKANCETLLSDLRHVLLHPAQPDADEEARTDRDISTYFLGSIIVRDAGKDKQKVDVYDGLQRLTTITILAALLRDLTKTPALAQRLHALVAQGGSVRLRLRVGADRFNTEIQARGHAISARRMVREISESEQCFRTATRYFLEQLRQWRPEQIDEFAIGLLDKVCVCLTDVDDERIARHIFVSTNLHGVRLNRADLFKGQLLDIAQEAAAEGQILAVWKRLQAKLGDELDAFLVAVDFIERRQRQSVDCLTKLAATLAETRPGTKIAGWVAELERHSAAWLELHHKMQTVGPHPLDRDIWKLRFFWWPEWKPLALLWYSEFLRKSVGHTPHPNSVTALSDRFSALHARCLAIILADYTPNERAIIFGKAITQERNGRNPCNDALTFYDDTIDKIRRSLKTPMVDDDKLHSTIRWIEASLWGDKIPDHLATTTIEHVLPQNPGPDSAWRRQIPDPADLYDAAHSLGNLICLDADRNKALENKDYVDKYSEYQRKPEYKTLSQVAAVSDWNKQAIDAREEQLASYVLQELRLPIKGTRPPYAPRNQPT